MIAVDDETPGGTQGGLNRLEGRVLIDRYRIDNVVSSGANTIIAEAIDLETDGPVTVKIVRPELAVTTEFHHAFRRQVEVAKSLMHPNIASVLDWGEIDVDGESTLFWVVEYLGGGSLRDIFDRGRLLQPSQALVVGLEACRALDAAHDRGVLHTELTPSKLVFGADARLRIVDFAMAQLLGADAWAEPATVATHVARYASPEQALSLEVDEKTDVYALSLCLIEAVTGKVPFAGDSTVSTLAGRVGKLMPVTADMGSLASVLERGGRPDSEDRWTAAEFGRALVQAAETLPRPEPIPVMATSLFASALAARTAAATPLAVAPEADSDADVVEPDTDDTSGAAVDAESEAVDGPSTPSDANGADVTSDEPVGSDHGEAPVEPLILLTDVSDNPTGAVQVGTNGAGAGAGHTAEMPASVAAAAAVATTPPTTVLDVVDGTPSGTVYDDERPSRSWAKYLLLGLIVLVGIGALSFAGWLLLRTKSYEVPDLTGVDEAVALNEISGNGWEIQTERERSDEVPDIDHVVRTIPAAGEKLDEGETFVMYVSDGPELRTLPEFAGTPLDEAVATIEELALVAAEQPAEYSETVAAGSVIRWQVQGDASLVAGAQVLPETVIELVPSLGPEPRPAPDLTNMTAAEATAALDALQLVYAPAEDVFSATIEAGRVAAQNPPPATPVERGGAVSVQISKGPELVAIPDMTGMSYPDAQAALTNAGFVVNSLLGTTEGTFVSVSVGGTEAKPGDMFPRGTGVDLIFL